MIATQGMGAGNCYLTSEVTQGMRLDGFFYRGELIQGKWWVIIITEEVASGI